CLVQCQDKLRREIVATLLAGLRANRVEGATLRARLEPRSGFREFESASLAELGPKRRLCCASRALLRLRGALVLPHRWRHLFFDTPGEDLKRLEGRHDHVGAGVIVWSSGAYNPPNSLPERQLGEGIRQVDQEPEALDVNALRDHGDGH